MRPAIPTGRRGSPTTAWAEHGGDMSAPSPTRPRPPRRAGRDPPACGRLHRIRRRDRPHRRRRAPDEVPASASTLATAIYAGMDPVATLERYADRLDYIHFKDIDADVFAAVMGDADPLLRGLRHGRDVPDRPRRDRLSRPSATLLHRIGYGGFITVEQERDPRNAGGSLADVKASRDTSAASGSDREAKSMINGERRTQRPIRWAMVGGGRGSQIGYIHRSAALRDRTFDLVAGAFDIEPARGQAFGVDLGLDRERCYGDYEALFAGEAARPDGIEAVSIATPNNTHFAIAESCARTWPPHRLRETALLHGGRSRGAPAPRRSPRADRRHYLRLRGLRDDRAGPGHGGGGRTRRDPLGQPAVRPRLPQRCPSSATMPPCAGASIRASPGRATCWATSPRIRSTFRRSSVPI